MLLSRLLFLSVSGHAQVSRVLPVTPPVTVLASHNNELRHRDRRRLRHLIMWRLSRRHERMRLVVELCSGHLLLIASLVAPLILH